MAHVKELPKEKQIDIVATKKGSDTIDATENLKNKSDESRINIKDSNRSRFISSLEVGSDNDIDRLLALKTYERNNLDNKEENDEKKAVLENIKIAYNEGNFTAAGMLIKSNKEKLDENFVDENTQEDSTFNHYFKQTYRMVGSAVEGAINNVFEIGDDVGQILEKKYGITNSYLVLKDGTVTFTTEKPEDFNPRPIEFVDSPDGIGWNMGAGMLEFFVPYTLMLKAFGGYRKGEVVKNIFKIYSAGAVADFMFSPEHGNFASLLVELGIENEFIAWLDSRPDEGFDIEDKMRSRGKQIIEGALVAGMFETIFRGGMFLFRQMKKNPEWVATAKSYLVGKSEGLAIEKSVSESPALSKSIVEAGSDIKTSPTDISLTGEKVLPSQTKGTDLSLTGIDKENILPLDKRGLVASKIIMDSNNKPIFHNVNKAKPLVVLAKNTAENIMKNHGDGWVKVEGFSTSKLKSINMKAWEGNIEGVGSVKMRLKNEKSLMRKINERELNPNNISDYIGMRILVAENNSLSKGHLWILRNFDVIEMDFKKDIKSMHYQVKEKGSTNGFSFEIQVRPDAIEEHITAFHVTYYQKHIKKILAGKIDEINESELMKLVNAEARLNDDLERLVPADLEKDIMNLLEK